MPNSQTDTASVVRLPSSKTISAGTFAALFAGLGGYGIYASVQMNPTQIGSTLLIDNPSAQKLDVMERRAQDWKIAITSLQRAIDNEVFDADGADVRRTADLMEAVFEASAIAMGGDFLPAVNDRASRPPMATAVGRGKTFVTRWLKPPLGFHASA